MAFGDNYTREIFEYNNGQQVVSVDPMRARGRLHTEALPYSVSTLQDAIDKGDADGASPQEVADKWGAIEKLREVVCKAFDLPEGTNTDFALGLLDHFFEYLEKKNLPLVWHPTSTQPLESPSPQSSVESLTGATSAA